MVKYKITEDNLQNIISESVTRFLAEAKNDENIGGWLGKQVGKLGKWANDNVNDYRANKQQYKQGQTSSTKTSTQTQNPETPSNTGNQITLQDIEQALTQLNQQFAQLKNENPVQSDTSQQTTNSQEQQDVTDTDDKQENQENQNTNDFEKYNNEGPETKNMIEKGVESGLGYDEKNKQFTNPHNLTNVDLNKWNQELKDAVIKDSAKSNSNTQQNNQNTEAPKQQTSNSANNDMASKMRTQMNRAVNPMYFQDGNEDVNDGKISNKPVISEDKLEKIISESIKRYLKTMK